VRWAGLVTHTRKKRSLYGDLVVKPERKRALGRSGHKWENSIKSAIKKWKEGHEIDMSGSGQGQVAGFCKHCNERSGCIKCGEFIDRLRNCYLFKRNCRSRRTVTIYTDSRITILSLKNKKNHSNLIDEIRRKTITLERQGWTIKFTWIKAHDGNFGMN
jgi:hypothetical protein